MKNKSLLLTIAISLIGMYSVAQVKDTFTDARDGKTYKTVKIGSQMWMAENLGYKASNGCWIYDNKQSNVATFGYLYNWETAKNVCPKDWHLPSDAEWSTLITYLGGETVAGGKLKETGTIIWYSPNTRATNESGFTALPSGSRDNKDGKFYNIGVEGDWWSSTEGSATSAIIRGVNYDNSSVASGSLDKLIGFSVRCIKN